MKISSFLQKPYYYLLNNRTTAQLFAEHPLQKENYLSKALV